MLVGQSLAVLGGSALKEPATWVHVPIFPAYFSTLKPPASFYWCFCLWGPGSS